ncbi:MAG: T9SS type A sorting domain-containing protein, partial [Tannerella sp.]|nr:T9SS type A sorting domain-containing protein [Tannerella sp.]
KSIRPVASGVTEAIFTVSNLADAGTLSFYIMSRNEGATLYVEYQAIGASGWTVLKTVEDNYTAYTQLTCDIKQNTPVNIRFRVTKDDGKSGYQLDDISISAYTPPTGIASPSPGKQHIASDGKAIRLTADGAASFRIMSAAGQAVRAGNFEGERQIASLPPGIYLVKLTTAVGASVRKVAIR